jgi:transcriptional regulator with XRE-family HTH domain
MLSFLENQTLPPQEMRLYRRFLGMTQARLASELCTTTTSISRWESELAPISAKTLSHLHHLVAAKLQSEIKHLFARLQPTLSISRYDKLVGDPSARFTQDGEGNLYLGSVFIDPGYRKHVFYLKAEDGEWYGIGENAKAVRVNEEFLRKMIDA